MSLATDEAPSPRQPNERDESADSQQGAPRKRILQAHDDLAAGTQDTDCRNRAAEIVKRNTDRARNGRK